MSGRPFAFLLLLPVTAMLLFAPVLVPEANAQPSGRVRLLPGSPRGCPRSYPTEGTPCTVPTTWRPAQRGADYTCDYRDSQRSIHQCICSGNVPRTWTCIAPG